MKKLLLHSLPLLLATHPVRAAGPVDFNRDIRPLLNKNCTGCHGGVKQASEVSFIYREEALGKGKSGEIVVVPGDPSASELIRRIKATDPDDRMPPPEEHPKPLSDKEIALFEQWVKEGAKWGEHWAFQKPVKTARPAVKDTAWPKTDLDRFVLVKLEAEHLTPSPAASAREWLRRASLDLTGLPPSLEEWQTFEQDYQTDPQAAKTKAADRLLASPRYGERWASMWLDLARYSDTMGFEKDPHRDVWPFRDWVINAFNADMPFDQFTAKHLAGDLLENPEPGDLIATTFHRNTQNNTEGGTDDEEYRTAAVMDRVATTWTAWQGTTFACVQCHSHPYDPIPHDDYYKFMAFFNNTEDVDLNNEFPRSKVAQDPTKQGEVVKLEKSRRALRDAINSEALAKTSLAKDWKPFLSTKATTTGPEGKLTQQADGTILAGGTNPTNSTYTLEGTAMPLGLLKFEILPESDDPKAWRGFGAVVSKLAVDLVKADGTRQPVEFKEVIADFLAGPFDPNEAIKDGVPGFGEYPMTKGPRTAWFAPKQPVISAGGDRWEIRILQGAVCNETQACVLKRFRISFSPDEAATSFVNAPERAARWKGLELLDAQYQAIPGKTIPVIQERSDAARRDTRVFIRGNRLTLDHSVPSGIPAIMGPPVKQDHLTRLDMARWLTGGENPLASRVLANRLWAELFGIGIVETQEDFGSAGLPPSNQPLLDHLALRLRVGHAWHLKPFLRELVLSATYGQSSKITPELAKRDAKNQLLARGPRQRLTAEMVRDQALLVSGLLSSKQYGPPVYPPQPEGIWKSVYSGAKWNTSQGEDRYRRAVYTYSKRTSGYPPMLVFDAPTRDICTARRVATNTPLQALEALNDPAQIEFAQALAKRMESAGTNLSERIATGYRLLTLQAPSEEVATILLRLHTEAAASYAEQPGESAKLAATPDQAALVLVANTLLNADQILNR